MKANRTTLGKMFAVASCVIWCETALLTQSSSSQNTSAPPYVDPTFEVKETSRDGNYALWILPPQLSEATVTIETESENTTVAPRTPLTLSVSATTMNLRQSNNVLQANQTDHNQRYEFHWTYHWQLGLRGGKADPSTVYALPFDPGTNCRVSQGYFGTYSHQNEYAVDFVLPEGTPICAARDGVVIAVRSDSAVGGPDLALYKNAANYVVIKHSDGTYASYLHLMHNGALVKVGQQVRRGEHIAKVGSTGAVTCPHLHFEVGVPIDGRSRTTFPTRFETASGIIEKPMQGETYVAN